MGYELDYLHLIQQVAHRGTRRPSRVGDTISKFGEQLRIACLQHDEFPLLTTRKLFYKPVFGELAAFLDGATSVSQFEYYGCNYWGPNARTWQDDLRNPQRNQVGRVYGAQWRDWLPPGYAIEPAIDQISLLLEGLKENPYGRRHVVTAWNPGELTSMCLPPCHIMFQCYVGGDDTLSMQIYMRSVDLCLGLPADVILYSALLLVLCEETGRRPGDLLFTFGDAHIYVGHLETMEQQCSRMIREPPTFEIAHEVTVDTFGPDSIIINDYNPQEALKYELYV